MRRVIFLYALVFGIHSIGVNPNIISGRYGTLTSSTRENKTILQVS